MKLIAIETSSKTGSIALLEDRNVLGEVQFSEGLSHGREIMLRITEMLKESGTDLSALEAVAVSQGPGSYTGLRVGVTTAKTLAWSLGAKLVGVPTPDVIAENADSSCEHVAIALDAKRGEIYASRYERKKGILQRTGDLEVMKPDDFAAMLTGNTCLLGDTAGIYANIWGSVNVKLIEPEGSEPRASVVGLLGQEMLDSGKEVKTPHDLAPIYLRLSEAEEKLKAQDKRLTRR